MRKDKDENDREDNERAEDRLRRLDRYRGTISIDHKPRPEDAKWYGHAPRPVPETDKNFRVDTIKF